jgi:hypothetical protein
VAEKLMLVCDTCGNPAVETVTFRTSAGNRQRGYCARHVQELLKDSRAPKRGREPGSVPKRKKTSARKPVGRKAAASRKK